MIKIFCFLALSVLACCADAPNDKFDLSVTSVGIKGNALELGLKIVNQSANPIKIDLTTAVVTVKSNPDGIQPQDVATRLGIYKPRVTLFVPENKPVFMPPVSARVFAPQILGAGQTLNLTKEIPMNPSIFLKDVVVNPYEVVFTLAFQTPTDPSCQIVPPSPKYQMTLKADGTWDLVAPPVPAPPTP